ncbi:aldose 1-epimerase [Silvimonas iriomotensis]|uniref:aldose 1-epimerase n=1 Tax=Silvimonas iriomotensis TaxID=449662 RepID=UPI001666CAC4|nr:aldose 1-epimerase [Silvimonas iriomotensis]
MPLTASSDIATIAPALIRLSCAEQTLLLAPAVGGSIYRYFSVRHDEEIHWLRPGKVQSLDEANPLLMGSFPLLPFCNRIRNGRAPAGERALHMAANMSDSPHTLHGHGWRLPWQVATVAVDAATLTLEYPRGDWPWSFHASQRFELTRQGLTVRMTLTNTDTSPMPAGLGHHPYFLRSADTVVKTDVEAMWAADAEIMPTQLEHPALLDALRQGQLIDHVVLDNNFTGWSRSASVTWPQQDARLTLHADAPLDFFVLYVPPGLDHFCMEPVSNCTDWLNLAEQHPGKVGGTWLQPGETLSVRFVLEPHWL